MDKSLITPYIQPRMPLNTGLRPQGALAHPVQAVLFDVYGTLFISASGDSGPLRLTGNRIAQLQRLIDKYALPLTTARLVSAFRKAITTAHSELKAGGIDYPEVDIETIWRRVLPSIPPGDIRSFAVEFEFIVNPVYPMPNLGAFLGACARQTAVMGIISNAQFYTPYLFEWLLDADLSALGFDSDLVTWSYRRQKAKPAPELFEESAAKLARMGILPQNVLLVGNDMLNDIYPARNCNFQTALYAGDTRSLRLRREDPRCRDLRPDLTITELDQILPFISEER